MKDSAKGHGQSSIFGHIIFKQKDGTLGFISYGEDGKVVPQVIEGSFIHGGEIRLLKETAAPVSGADPSARERLQTLESRRDRLQEELFKPDRRSELRKEVRSRMRSNADEPRSEARTEQVGRRQEVGSISRKAWLIRQVLWRKKQETRRKRSGKVRFLQTQNSKLKIQNCFFSFHLSLAPKYAKLKCALI